MSIYRFGTGGASEADIRRATSDSRRLSRDVNRARRDARRRGDDKGALEIGLQASQAGIRFGGIEQAGDRKRDVVKGFVQNSLDARARARNLKAATDVKNEQARHMKRLNDQNLIGGFFGGDNSDSEGVKGAVDSLRRRVLNGSAEEDDNKFKPKNQGSVVGRGEDYQSYLRSLSQGRASQDEGFDSEHQFEPFGGSEGVASTGGESDLTPNVEADAEKGIRRRNSGLPNGRGFGFGVKTQLPSLTYRRPSLTPPSDEPVSDPFAKPPGLKYRQPSFDSEEKEVIDPFIGRVSRIGNNSSKRRNKKRKL